MVREIGKKSLKFYFFLFTAVTYLPLILLIAFSFNDSFIVTAFPFRGFTLEWWSEFFHDPIAIRAVTNSLMLAASSSLIATGLGLLIAYPIVRHFKFRGMNFLTYSALLPLVIPPITVGISLLLLFSRIFDLSLSLFTVLVGHILLGLPFTTLVLMARLIGFDISLEEAAQDLGASEITTFRKITVPLIMPGIFVAVFLSFSMSMMDVDIAFFLSGAQSTVPMFVYGKLRRWEGLPTVMALSGLMVVISLAIAIVYMFIMRRRS
jgi:spermidine/putrescine transport system permease protein